LQVVHRLLLLFQSTADVENFTGKMMPDLCFFFRLSLRRRQKLGFFRGPVQRLLRARPHRRHR
jgi:hypothetical protein